MVIVGQFGAYASMIEIILKEIPKARKGVAPLASRAQKEHLVFGSLSLTDAFPEIL